MLVISWRTHWRHGIDQLHDDVPATWLTNGSAYNLLRLFRFITGKMNYFRRCYPLHCLNKHTSSSFDHFITQLREHYFSLRFGGLHTVRFSRFRNDFRLKRRIPLRTNHCLNKYGKAQFVFKKLLFLWDYSRFLLDLFLIFLLLKRCVTLLNFVFSTQYTWCAHGVTFCKPNTRQFQIEMPRSCQENLLISLFHALSMFCEKILRVRSVEQT